MGTYSDELRRKIAGALQGGMAKSEAAHPFDSSLSSVKQYDSSVRNYSGCSIRDTHLGVELLLLAQHPRVLTDASCPRLRTLSVLDLVQDRVPVPAVERGEELSGYLVLLELSPQIVRHRRGALRIVSRIPPPIGLGPLYLPQPGGLHLAPLDELGSLLAVDLRPLAPRSTRREPLQPVLVVEGGL